MSFSVVKIFILQMFLFFPFFLFASKKEMIVVIDPGHGGRDVGTAYNNINEKDITLKIGLILGKYINENLPEVKVIFTREKDEFIPLHKRAEMANQNKADLFISLHANFCDIPSITGSETFILGLHRSEENLDVAKKENAVILFEEDHTERYEGFDPNLSESYIMFELIQDEFLGQSADFANEIQNQLQNQFNKKDRGVKQAGFLVLRQTSMPSVLIETGFLSNPAEAQYLDSEEGQSLIAFSIFKAFKNYKKGFDAKSEYNLPSTAEPDTIKTQETKKEIIEAPEIYFSIQLAATFKDLKTTPSNFKGLENVSKTKSGNVFKYYYGHVNKYEDIETLKKQVKKKYPDSFTVAFRNNQLIPVQEALKLLKSN